ncbi:MAG: DUF2905 domain-containing protein [Acidobacteria bacterium]|nr:DUF2905 domain-containing protein [Acidobacteriota bacterium]
MHPAKLLMLSGLILLLAGAIWYFAGWSPFSWLGRFPGDISIRRGNWSLYLPITTCILLSILLTLLLQLFRR